MKIYKIDKPELSSVEIKTISQHLRHLRMTASSCTETIAKPGHVVPCNLGIIVLSDNLQKTSNSVSEIKDFVDVALEKFKKDDYGNIPENFIHKNIKSRYYSDGTAMFGAYETNFGWLQIDTMTCDNKAVTLVSLMKRPNPNYAEELKPAVEVFVKTNTTTLEK